MAVTQKAKIIEKLVMYFMEKGKILSYKEYVDAGDGPYRATHIRRKVGSWALIERIISNNYPEEYALIIGDLEPEKETVVILDIPKKGQENEEVNEPESDEE